MHDFDEVRAKRLEKDRSFKIGGETFTYRPGVEPEVIAQFEDAAAGMTAKEALVIVDTVVLSWLDHGQEEKWRQVRQPCDNPITLDDMTGLVRWLMEQTTDRPTEQPSGSAASGGSTAASSTAGSPSLALAASGS